MDYFLNQSFGVLGDYATSEFGNSILDGMGAGDAASKFATSTMRFITSRLSADPTAASDVTSALYDMNDVVMGIVSDASLKGENQDAYAMLNKALTDKERKAAIAMAKALTKKDGALYAAKKRTSKHYDEIEEVMASDKPDEEKNLKLREIRMQMLNENAAALDKAEKFWRMYVIGTPAQYERIYGKK